jgi:hypothetical protein
MRRSRRVDEFEVGRVADRLLPYGLSPRHSVEHDEAVEDELFEKAVTLLTFMPGNQPRERLEKLLSPNDPQRGRRAVDALIDAALATEDERGRLRRIARDEAPRSGARV